MPVRVAVVGLLKTYTDGKANFEFPPGKTIREIIQELKIPNELVAGAFVNDKNISKEYLTSDGDSIKLIAVIGGGGTEE